MFCFPEGGIEICKEDCIKVPRFFQFVSTGGEGSHIFGFCLVIYEPVSERHGKALGKSFFSSKALCLLSYWPFVSEFRQFLVQLYRLSMSPVVTPLERIISNFVVEVPLPPPGQVRVRYDIGDQEIFFSRPPST